MKEFSLKNRIFHPRVVRRARELHAQVAAVEQAFAWFSAAHVVVKMRKPGEPLTVEQIERIEEFRLRGRRTAGLEG